ncbi:MAG: hypothetical protein LUH63_12175 [Parabacteroides sp.]|nr:hypothetical protein [Parabacteroides sp.]
MESESVTNHTATPVKSSERHAILDVLRGLALLGIAIANFPEFSLYSFLPTDVAKSMPTDGIDRIVHYLQYIFIDGNFIRYSRCCSARVSRLSSPMRQDAVRTASVSSIGVCLSCC